jgi:hypothetical protein
MNYIRNPFSLKELSIEEPFCDRDKEMKELASHALNFTNVVLYSPRRYGKTSLVKRVQNAIHGHDAITIYVDFFGVGSMEAVANKFATYLYSYCHHNENLFQKAMRFISIWRPVIKPDPEMGITITAEPTTQMNGLKLLEETFSLFGKFIKEHAPGFHIVLDEFQEITELRESKQIEGVLRSQIQGHTNVSYFFVGSRRRILLDIFNDEKRPFYKSAINYELGPLPKKEAVTFIVDRFSAAGKTCSPEIASRIYDKVRGYPYYLQRIPYSMYEIGGKTLKDEDYERALREALQEETPLFQAKVERLYPVWKQLLYALSREPVVSPLSTTYLKRHNLSSPGSTQPALKNLIVLDYIERRDEDGCYHIVDPIFDLYLKQSVAVKD